MTVTTADATAAVDPAALEVLFTNGHTAYEFTDEPVSDEQLAALYDLTKMGPTFLNSQPLRIVFVRTPEAKERLLPLLAEGNRPKSASAPVVAILAADEDFHEHLPRISPQAEGMREAFAANPNRLDAARGAAQMQAGYLILAARALGLDAGPMGGIDAAGIDAEFLAGTAWRTFMVVNLGHVSANGRRPRNPRLELDEAVSFV